MIESIVQLFSIFCYILFLIAFNCKKILKMDLKKATKAMNIKTNSKKKNKKNAETSVFGVEKILGKRFHNKQVSFKIIN